MCMIEVFPKNTNYYVVIAIINKNLTFYQPQQSVISSSKLLASVECDHIIPTKCYM